LAENNGCLGYLVEMTDQQQEVFGEDILGHRHTAGALADVLLLARSLVAQHGVFLRHTTERGDTVVGIVVAKHLLIRLVAQDSLDGPVETYIICYSLSWLQREALFLEVARKRREKVEGRGVVVKKWRECLAIIGFLPKFASENR
jgi:hypothetical protein